jgi:hypothetical protein
MHRDLDDRQLQPASLDAQLRVECESLNPLRLEQGPGGGEPEELEAALRIPPSDACRHAEQEIEALAHELADRRLMNKNA